MAGRRRTPERRGRASDGQHFLRSAELATELVDAARVGRDDVVVEIGGGTGRLTEPLAARARRVLVIELDPVLAAALRDRFASTPSVEIVCANALDAPLPPGEFRVFGNLPFGFGTRILRRFLDSPAGGMMRLDALLQFEMARKRAQLVPSSLVSIGWLPWWELTLGRRVHRTAFAPQPGVDAAMLRVERRLPPLLPPSSRPAFVSFVAHRSASPAAPVSSSFGRRMPPSAWRRFTERRGLPIAARPADLGVEDWVALFTETQPSAASRPAQR